MSINTIKICFIKYGQLRFIKYC